MPKQLGALCDALFVMPGAASIKKQAWGLMGGKADMGKGGTYRLTEHPDWKPQAGTDTSGDRHVHSLNWALPLLYRGVAVQNEAMVKRFSDLIRYWIADHQGKRAYWVDGSIYGGLRTQVLACAGQTLNDPVIIEAARRDANTMLGAANYQPGATAYGRNNTDLVRQNGALAVSCLLGDPAMAGRAWRNASAIARGVVQPDGSDIEGSPWYAIYIEQLIRQTERTAPLCGIDASSMSALRGSIIDFVAQAVRPDGKLETLGDTTAVPVPANFGPGDVRAAYVRNKGAQGTPPASRYQNFMGGYAFGRSDWQVGGPGTFYSVRYSSTRPGTAHTHDDGGSVTLFSRGVQWISDPGPYRYENASAMRGFVRSRPAHSTFTVNGVLRDRGAGTRMTDGRSDLATGGNDVTCVNDATYRTVGVRRCVLYIRSVDALVVVDRVTAAPGRGKRQVVQRWQLQPGMAGTDAGGVLTLANGDARLDVYKGGAGNWSVDVARKGSSVGWQTGKWGERLPSAVLKRTANLLRTGSSQTLVTAFVPRMNGESVPVTIGTDSITISRGGTTITTPLP